MHYCLSASVLLFTFSSVLSSSLGFGLVLTGDSSSAQRASLLLPFDVCNGVARRAWSGNHNASIAIRRAQEAQQGLKVTEANFAEDNVLEEIMKKVK